MKFHVLKKNSPLFASPVIFGRAHLKESVSQGGAALAELESYMQPLAIVPAKQGREGWLILGLNQWKIQISETDC